MLAPRIHSRTDIGLLAVVLLALGACGDDEGQSDNLTVATYNAGLAPGFVPFSDERAEPTTTAIAEIPADVVCVQELWREQDLHQLLVRAGGTWAQAMFLEPGPMAPEPGTPPACGEQEIQELANCALQSCGDVPPDQLIGCVFSQCAGAYAATGPQCQTCLAASVGGSMQQTLQTCVTEPGPRYAYGGSFGLALLIDGVLAEQDSLLLESTLNRRAVIYTQAWLPEAGNVNVFCTHLTAVFDQIPMPGEGSWEAEQRAQIERMLAFIDDKTTGEQPTILLGDLNTGPAIDGISAEVPDNYQLLLDAGFVNPYADILIPSCTFCADNPLVSDEESVLIDHVLIRDARIEAVDGRRILDEPIEVGVNGGSVPSALSDHYGVLVEVQLK